MAIDIVVKERAVRALATVDILAEARIVFHELSEHGAICQAPQEWATDRLLPPSAVE